MWCCWSLSVEVVRLVALLVVGVAAALVLLVAVVLILLVGVVVVPAWLVAVAAPGPRRWRGRWRWCSGPSLLS